MNRHRVPWFGKLILREMMEPTGMLDPLIEQFIRPEVEFLLNIVRELLGPAERNDSRLVQWCAMSILGQCLFCSRPGSLLLSQYLKRNSNGRDVERLAEHITQFSLLAIR